MRINCPLHGDDDTCDEPMEVTIEPGHPGSRHEPGYLPGLKSVEGFCRHAKQFNSGDLPDDDLEFLTERVLEEEYDKAQAQYEARQ